MSEKNPVTKVAVKFCGGCNPTYDRVHYWHRVRAAVEGRINWVGTDEPDPDALILICGCPVSCPEQNFRPDDYGRLIVVRDEGRTPEEIAKIIQK